MKPFQVRPMREADIESIISIDALITGAGGPDRAGFWRGLLSLHAPPPDEPPATGEADPLPSLHLCQVAEASGSGNSRLVGFIIGDVQSWQFGLPRHGRIVTIGVHPEFRRRDVATLLVESLMETFRKMGLPFVHCLARPGEALGTFFESLGFRRPGFEILERSLRS